MFYEISLHVSTSMSLDGSVSNNSKIRLNIEELNFLDNNIWNSFFINSIKITFIFSLNHNINHYFLFNAKMVTFYLKYLTLPLAEEVWSSHLISSYERIKRSKVTLPKNDNDAHKCIISHFLNWKKERRERESSILIITPFFCLTFFITLDSFGIIWFQLFFGLFPHQSYLKSEKT